MRTGPLLAPPAGLTQSEGRLVFRCAAVGCGREQGYTPEGQHGGVTAEEARLVGWQYWNTVAVRQGVRVCSGGGWYCPFCAGDLENLRRVFGEEGR